MDVFNGFSYQVFDNIYVIIYICREYQSLSILNY
jgi:hypothetical protein